MKTILGTMTINYDYTSSDNNIDDHTKIIQEYINNVDEPILDTAYYYGNTKTEATLGQIIPSLSEIPKIATKANPWFKNDFSNNILGQLSKTGIEHQITTSLKNLKLDKVDIFYLHCPDNETPINETLEYCTELFRKEKFNQFGLSNYSKDQIIEILSICEEKGYILPTYYQGMYNMICRKVEETFPILRKNNIEFWAYNPLAGGLLTGKYKNLDLNLNSRFKNNKIYQNIFMKDEIVNVVNDLNKDNDILNTSFKWYEKCSKLSDNDGLIIGVSSLKQLNQNLKILNDDFNIKNVKEISDKYNNIKNITPNYYY